MKANVNVNELLESMYREFYSGLYEAYIGSTIADLEKVDKVCYTLETIEDYKKILHDSHVRIEHAYNLVCSYQEIGQMISGKEGAE